MEELHGRTIHDAKDVITLPLLLLPGVTLVPGQVIPLHLFHPQVHNSIFSQHSSISFSQIILELQLFGPLSYVKSFGFTANAMQGLNSM